MTHPLNPLKHPLKTRGASRTHDEPRSAPNAPRAVLAGVARAAACRDFSRDPQTDATWFQTFPPYGRYPVGGTVDGAAPGAEFVFDEAAAKSVLDAFRRAAEDPNWPGVLVDREHLSAERDGASDAMAWARDIRQEPDGSIWTRWDFTEPGRALWEGRVLVSRSPLFACARDGRDYRPVELVSIGMTNTPHFSDLSTRAAARAATTTDNTKGTHDMDPDILAALGLGPDATKEDALAAIGGLKDGAAAAEEKAGAAEKARDEAVAECRATRADAFIAANAAKIADPAAFREAYLANPDLAERTLAACRAAAPATPQQVLPAGKAAPARAQDALAGLAKCRSAAERCAYALAHAREIAEAAK